MIEQDILKELVINRRKIHSFPELQYMEIQTANLVENHLSSLGLKYESGIAGTGIACLIDSGKPGKTILVRADMDALPIHEENKVDYVSKVDGVMHACGHDGHTSVLMSIAAELSRNSKKWIPKGRVLLVFQPAEEGGCGADKMIEEGLLEKYKVDSAFALHVWNHIDIGKIGVVNGPMMAAVDEFSITIKGKSGHGAMPQHTVDPIVVSAHIITALQTIVSRNTDPLDSCVVTVGSIHGGDAFNVIPEEVKLKGTVRTFSQKLYKEIEERFTGLVKTLANSFGAQADVIYRKVDKPTINDPIMADLVRESSIEVLGEGCITEEEAKTMGGEDFSAFLMEVPGCYFFVGSRNESAGFIYPHHNSKFDFDEGAMLNGYKVMLRLIQKYLENY